MSQWNDVRRLRNLLGVLINPATEDTLAALATAQSLDSPTTIAAKAITDVQSSHTITAGKRNLIIQNTGANTVFWGGNGVLSTTGHTMLRQNGYEFRNCETGFIVYFICAAGLTSTVRIQEL